MSSTTIPAAIKTEIMNGVQDHLHGVIHSAATTARHCKRARLHHSTGDVHTRIQAADINMALKSVGCHALYTTTSNEAKKKKKTTIVRLQDVVQSTDENTVWRAPPVEVAVQQSWLAVDGVAVESAGTSTSTTTPPTDLTTTTTPHDNTNPSSLFHVDHLLVAGLLSDELRLLFTRVTTQLDDPVVLCTLATTRGLQELVPFFLRFFQQALYVALAADESTKSPYQARQVLRFLWMLLHNPHVHVEMHLQMILPPLLAAVPHVAPDAAAVLVVIVQLFGATYTTLSARICHSLSSHKDIIACEGTLGALTFLQRGHVVVETIVEHYPEWNGPTQQAALTCGQRLQNPHTVALDDMWGESAVALCRVETPYSVCFL